jgi:hypothetical protein
MEEQYAPVPNLFSCKQSLISLYITNSGYELSEKKKFNSNEEIDLRLQNKKFCE